MSQIKIYALNETIAQLRIKLSNAIHEALVESLAYPKEKIFQRFFPLEKENFIYPADRSDLYTIIEISMFEGRSKEAKKAFILKLIQNIHLQCGIGINDIEITIFETPKENWGIRGQNADELVLNYKVNV